VAVLSFYRLISDAFYPIVYLLQLLTFSNSFMLILSVEKILLVVSIMEPSSSCDSTPSLRSVESVIAVYVFNMSINSQGVLGLL
jgi:hypothetical protein